MIRFFKFLILLLCLFTGLRTVKGQDGMYSQSYAAPMLISPSFAGLSFGSRLSLNYRDQWPGALQAYRNYALSWDGFFENYNSGVGIMFNRNDQGHGMYVYQNLSFLYSYDLEIVRGYYIRPGMQFQYVDRAIDFSKLYFGNQINPDNGEVTLSTSGSGTEHTYKFDVGASVMGYTDFAWFGFGFDHLVKGQIGYTDMGNYNNIKTTVYGGTKFNLHKVLAGQTQQTLSFAFQYLNQGGFNQLNIGTYYFLNPLEIGVWYRGVPVEKVGSYVNNDALIFIAGITLGPVKFAYSYDLTLSPLAGYSGGANEISLVWLINSSFTGKSRHGAIPCPGVINGSNTSRKFSSTRR